MLRQLNIGMPVWTYECNIALVRQFPLLGTHISIYIYTGHSVSMHTDVRDVPLCVDPRRGKGKGPGKAPGKAGGAGGSGGSAQRAANILFGLS